MTEPQTDQTELQTEPRPSTRPTSPPPPAATPTKAPSWLDVVRAQRKVIGVGLTLMVACFWFIGQVGEWRTAALTATGILLALLNHLASEHWLGKLISSGSSPPAAASPRRPSPGWPSSPSSPWGPPWSSGPTASACSWAWPCSD